MAACKLPAAILAVSVLLGSSAFAATATINGVAYDNSQSSPAQSSVEASLRLKKVFLFPSLDDLSGVLAPQLDEKLQQLFQANPRFDLVRDTQVLKALAPDDKAYGKAALNQAVHKEAARVTGADTTVLLRTRNVGRNTEMTLEFRDANGELLFSESGTIPGLSPMTVRWGLIDKLFQAVLSKIPFDGTVTGRTANTLTLDLGSRRIKRGQEVDLVRIVSVQRHPLLHTVVGTDYVRVGRAVVTNVDSALSFADLTQEYPGETVNPGAKVLLAGVGIVHRPELPAEGPKEGFGEAQPKERAEKDPLDERLKGDFDKPKARYGQLGLNLQYGSLTHSQTASGATSEYSGSGIGGDVEGELWVTKNWIVSLFYGFQSATLTGSSGSIGDTSWKRVEGFAGYRFFPDELSSGLQITGSLGYQAEDFSIPTQAASAVSGKRYSGLALKLEGEMPLFPRNKISGGFGFQPFSSLSDSGASPGSPDGGNVIGFHLGWDYQLGDQFWAKLGFQFDTASGNYTNSSSVGDKRFAIGPGIYYSF
jgi:hypothetical protein